MCIMYVQIKAEAAFDSPCDKYASVWRLKTIKFFSIRIAIHRTWMPSFVSLETAENWRLRTINGARIKLDGFIWQRARPQRVEVAQTDQVLYRRKNFAYTHYLYSYPFYGVHYLWGLNA